MRAIQRRAAAVSSLVLAGAALGQGTFRPASEVVPVFTPLSAVNAGQVLFGLANRFVFMSEASGSPRIVVRDAATGVNRTLDLPPGGVNVELVGVSENGERVLGRVAFGTTTRAVIWDGDGPPQIVPAGGFAIEAPSAMSADGTRWTVQTGIGEERRSFLAGVDSATPIEVDSQGDPLATLATAISPDGLTVGGQYGQAHGTLFLWSEAGGSELFFPPTTGQTTPKLISNGGTRLVVSPPYPNITYPAQTYSRGRWKSIPLMIPLCMTGDGALLGGQTLPNGSQAILWSDTRGLEDPRLMFAARGINASGWTLESVDYVSPDGSKMAGRGMVISTSARRWWVATMEPFAAADIGKTGGVAGSDGRMDNNDLIVFIDRFFAGDERADVGSTGAERGGDGEFDNNDFCVFITLFFTGAS